MKKLIVFILAVITALESLSIDLYLPAFPGMAQTFQTTLGNIQISLSLFLAGFACGQLLWGPLSDQYGRKPVLITGLALFIASSLTIQWLTAVEWLWFFRFLQAFGGCAGIVMSRAIVGDLFSNQQTVNIFAQQAQISGIAPILAPLLGSVLLTHWGWESIFTALSILGSLCLISVALFIPESYQPKPNLTEQAQCSPSLATLFGRTLLNRQFLLYTLVGGMAYSALMLYISSAPFVLIEKAGLSETQFSLAFGFNSLALILASYLTPKLLKLSTPRIIVIWASVALAITCLGLGLTLDLPLHVMGIISLLFLSLLPIGMLFPLTAALALETITIGRGTAAALLGCIQLLLSFVFSALTGSLQDDSVVPMIALRLFVGLLSVVLAIVANRASQTGLAVSPN